MASNSPTNPANSSSSEIPAKWAWHYRTLLALRRRLTGEREEHRQNSAGIAEPETNDFADTANDRYERDVLAAEIVLEEGMLSEVEAALQRIRAGTYGLCEVTGKTIPEARLRVLPWTRFTREAAEQMEKNRKR
ncbi:MAG: TraR/DksA family transcriptional regulator [Opitutales bacterium]